MMNDVIKLRRRRSRRLLSMMNDVIKFHDERS